MVRKRRIGKFTAVGVSQIVFFLTSLALASVQDAKTDLAWTDVGDSILNLEEEVAVQRDHKSINQNEGLLGVGDFFRLIQDVNQRLVPRGEKMGPLLKGQDFQILAVKIDSKRRRYYQVKSKWGLGYIYAGTKVSYAKWAKQIWSQDQKIIARAGDYVKVKRKRGLKLSKAPGTESFYKIPRGAQIQVESVNQNEEGKLFYKVKYKSRKGYADFGDLESMASKTWREVH